MRGLRLGMRKFDLIWLWESPYKYIFRRLYIVIHKSYVSVDSMNEVI